MNKTNTQKEIHPEVVFLPAPEGVDVVDIVSEIIGDDDWDIIYLDNGIVCKADRVGAVLEAYQQAIDELEEEDEE